MQQFFADLFAQTDWDTYADLMRACDRKPRVWHWLLMALDWMGMIIRMEYGGQWCKADGHVWDNKNFDGTQTCIRCLGVRGPKPTPMPQPRELPTVLYQGKMWTVDVRLSQLRFADPELGLGFIDFHKPEYLDEFLFLLDSEGDEQAKMWVEEVAQVM